jgi:hypothetical protein
MLCLTKPIDEYNRAELARLESDMYRERITQEFIKNSWAKVNGSISKATKNGEYSVNVTINYPFIITEELEEKIFVPIKADGFSVVLDYKIDSKTAIYDIYW